MIPSAMCSPSVWADSWAVEAENERKRTQRFCATALVTSLYRESTSMRNFEPQPLGSFRDFTPSCYPIPLEPPAAARPFRVPGVVGRKPSPTEPNRRHSHDGHGKTRPT
jgi:hypothetical protein